MRRDDAVADLTCSYLGLELKNPVVVSSSGLTNAVQGVKRCEAAGAVVLKSLFEEQIEAEAGNQQVVEDFEIHPEASQYVARMSKELGPSDYLALIREAKRAVGIPVIASVNCVSSRWWVDWAKQIEDAGADAIELNIAIMPRSLNDQTEEIESRFFQIIERVSAALGLPIAVKLGPYFTALPHLVSELAARGAKGLVLFNRFYQLDIDAEKMELAPGYRFSTSAELPQTLRWTSILSGDVACDLAASTGVESAIDVVKLLLAGAHVVQVCSTLYRNGYEYIEALVQGVEEWMDRHQFSSIKQFRGKLSKNASEQPEAYERSQYIRALTGIS